MPGDQGPNCGVCGLPYGQHSGRKCECCFAPVEHHSPTEQDACWEGRARMALARQASGQEMNRIDREALRRFPTPPLVGAPGY
jgi:hypothetical protein